MSAAELREALLTLEANWDEVCADKTSWADAAQLEATLASDDVSDEVKAAINTLLNVPGGYEAIASAGKGSAQSIDRYDLRAALRPDATIIESLTSATADGTSEEDEDVVR